MWSACLFLIFSPLLCAEHLACLFLSPPPNPFCCSSSTFQRLWFQETNVGTGFQNPDRFRKTTGAKSPTLTPHRPIFPFFVKE